MQNLYNLARRDDDDLVDATAAQGIAYVPYFPLGGFSPLQSGTLERVAKEAGATPMTVALAWLLQRSPNMLLIPGTSSVAHLRRERRLRHAAAAGRGRRGTRRDRRLRLDPARQRAGQLPSGPDGR